MGNSLLLIMGDQLSVSLDALKKINKDTDTILMMEVWDETTYAPHHPKKIVFVLSAMRHFAQELRTKGYCVDYIPLDSDDSKKTFTDTIYHYLQQSRFDRLVVTRPSEFRVNQMVASWPSLLKCQVDIVEDNRFFCGIHEFKNWAKGKKQLRMEFFYRKMREKTGFLMEDSQPVGGQWNYDSQNRKPFKNGPIPALPLFQKNETTKTVITLVAKKFAHHFGDIEPFSLAVTRWQAKRALADFIENRLSAFGEYQDAMLQDEAYLFHSWISLYLNVGLLLPEEVCCAAESAYFEKKAPLNAVEGFIRQVLGWREFIRGMYWLTMPGYDEKNYFNASRPLPGLYWGKETKMNCMQQVVRQTKENAYSHHIQRLMITGNFALLAGIDPKAVCEWYLAVYADAFDWVELPNTLGMALFADGGLVASKPYAASGNYINKMSDFCKHCHYKVGQKLGDSACPFNYLYWNFLIKNKKQLGSNPRLKFAYKHVQNLSAKQRSDILEQAQIFLNTL